ncbi:MAG: hypothetical protein ACK2U9_24740, partial [Anaerolineae bacterium]
NLSADMVAKPFSIAPDIWYGVSPKLTVGLVHSGYGATGFYGGAGKGLCLAGEDNGCAEVYDNVGVEAKFLVLGDGPLSLAANGGIHVLSLSDPMFLDLKVGVIGNYNMNKLNIGFAPNIFIGLTERDFNKEALAVPVYVMFQANPKLGAGVQTGISGPLDGFGDFYRIPVTIFAKYAVNPKICAGLAFSFDNLAGKDGSADYRSLNLMVGYAM